MPLGHHPLVLLVVVSFNKQLPLKDDGLRASDCYSTSLIPLANNLLQVWFFNYYVKCNLATINISYKKTKSTSNLPLLKPKIITFFQYGIMLIDSHKTNKFPSSTRSSKQCALILTKIILGIPNIDGVSYLITDILKMGG